MELFSTKSKKKKWKIHSVTWLLPSWPILPKLLLKTRVSELRVIIAINFFKVFEINWRNVGFYKTTTRSQPRVFHENGRGNLKTWLSQSFWELNDVKFVWGKFTFLSYADNITNSLKIDIENLKWSISYWEIRESTNLLWITHTLLSLTIPVKKIVIDKLYS